MTLPVLVGPAAALLLASVMLLGGAVAAISSLLTSSIPSAGTTTAAQAAGAAVALHALPPAAAWPHLACVALVTLSILQLLAQVAMVFRSGMDPQAISVAVDDCVKPMGLAIIMLAAMA